MLRVDDLAGLPPGEQDKVAVHSPTGSETGWHVEQYVGSDCGSAIVAFRTQQRIKVGESLTFHPKFDIDAGNFSLGAAQCFDADRGIL